MKLAGQPRNLFDFLVATNDRLLAVHKGWGLPDRPLSSADEATLVTTYWAAGRTPAAAARAVQEERS